MKRICWRSKITGAHGCGDPLTESVAKAWLRMISFQFPQLEHWLEDVEDIIA